jgi:hypothetical protein
LTRNTIDDFFFTGDTIGDFPFTGDCIWISPWQSFFLKIILRRKQVWIYQRVNQKPDRRIEKIYY